MYTLALSMGGHRNKSPLFPKMVKVKYTFSVRVDGFKGDVCIGQESNEHKIRRSNQLFWAHVSTE